MIIRKSTKNLLTILGYFFFTVVVSSCATGPKIEQADLSTLPKCSMVSRKYDGSHQYAVLDVSQARMAQIRMIDGKPFYPNNCDYYQVILSPGEHVIHFVYHKSIYLLHPRGRDPVALKFTAESGKRYQIIVDKHPFISKYNCRVKEVGSGKILHEIDDCDRDEIRYPALNEMLEVFGGRDAYLEYQEEWWPKDDFEQLHRHLR